MRKEKNNKGKRKKTPQVYVVKGERNRFLNSYPVVLKYKLGHNIFI